MTDRFKGCFVAFDADFRADDIAVLLQAIAQLKGVQSVILSPSDSSDWMNRERVRHQLIEQIYAALAPEKSL